MQASEPMTGMSDAALIEVLDPFAQQNGVCVEVSWTNGEVLHQCILGEVHGLETRGLVSPMSFVSRAKSDVTAIVWILACSCKTIGSTSQPT